MDLIEEHLYLGDYISATNKLKLKELNIKTILSVIAGSLCEADKLESIDYHRIDVEDSSSRDLLSYFPETNQLIANCQKSETNILVHCMVGISRSATIVIAYIMQKYRLSYYAARNLLRSKRSVINPNLGFEFQLELFAKMNFTLDANCRQFRHHLFHKYVLNKSQTNDINKYFERLSLAENMTENLNLGQQYNCAKCGHKLFCQLNVIENEDMSHCATASKSGQLGQSSSRCGVYIEPQKWLAEAFITSNADNVATTAKCSNCAESIALIEKRRAVCDCVAHYGSHCLKIRMLSNSYTTGGQS